MLKELEREKRILERTYHDRMDVYRYRLVRDVESGESRQEQVPVYENRRCALDLSGNGAPEKGTVADAVSTGGTLFADPGILLKENDLAVVRTVSGQVYEGRTGRTYAVLNHGETPLKIEKVV